MDNVIQFPNIKNENELEIEFDPETEMLVEEIDWVDRDNLKKLLREKEVFVTFTKSDGTERKMRCTLNPELMPKNLFEDKTDEEKPKRKENLDVIPVWDLESEGWRSFRLDSIVSVWI